MKSHFESFIYYLLNNNKKFKHGRLVQFDFSDVLSVFFVNDKNNLIEVVIRVEDVLSHKFLISISNCSNKDKIKIKLPGRWKKKVVLNMLLLRLFFVCILQFVHVFIKEAITASEYLKKIIPFDKFIWNPHCYIYALSLHDILCIYLLPFSSLVILYFVILSVVMNKKRSIATQ